MGVDITVTDDGDLVSASRDIPPAQAITEDAEPAVEAVVEEAAKPAEAADADAEPEVEEKPDAEAATSDRDEKGRFKKPLEKKFASIQAKIDDATRRRHYEEQRVAELETRRKQLETEVAPRQKPADADAAPATLVSFEDFTADYQAKNPTNTSYEKIVNAYFTVRDAALLQQFEQKQAAVAEVRELDAAYASHRERMDALIAETPDWPTLAAASDAYMSQRGFSVENLPATMKLAIIRSLKSERIVLDLAQHPEIAFQVALDAKDLPATPAAVKMVRMVLESRLGAAPAPSSGPGVAPRQSRSNPPPKPVGSSPHASDASGDEPPYEGPGGILERVTKGYQRR